jgi:signal peptidase I
LFFLFGVAILLTVVVGIPVHAARLARRAGSAYELQAFNRSYFYVAFFVLVGLVWQRGSSLFSKAYVAEAFRIPSTAGEPTLLAGDYIYVVKLPRSARHPGRDSLVVFRSLEQSGQRVIKRAVGLPGDTLTMRDGWVYRNGQRLSEPYATRHDVPMRSDEQYVSQMRAWQVAHLVGPDPARYIPTTRDWGPLAVPPDSFFALGDNRDESYDSRFYGCVPLANVSARPRLIYFSYDASSGVRWERMGRRIQ